MTMPLVVQWHVLLFMAGAGAGTGCLFDAYVPARPYSKFLVWVFDGMFWISCALLLYTGLYHVNGGVIRLPFFLFWLIGIGVYIMLLRPVVLPFIRIGWKIAGWVSRVLHTLFFLFLVHPARFLKKIGLSLAKMSHFLLLWIIKNVRKTLLFWVKT